jgi:serine/threonine protein kinase/WD40 repeat protein
MPESHQCPRCGAELPPDAPGGHCVSCLLQLGLADGSSAEPSGAQPGTIRLDLPSLTPAEKPGDRIGRYKLLQQIGEGGCGVVYMAEQSEPVRRRVALKVIKLGMDTKQVIARFEAERQALAMMDHPNIAKVFDAGATDAGRPYFVMELVRGVKITDYCDQQKLSTPQRLELFVQVCQAVQHAHQKGIIHRDLKPSNILVTELDGKAVPKVIDFGIAKATTAALLTDKTLFTAFDQFIGTPAYMSPEQAGLGGLDIDTRSDIYSLGVLLYELLTGKQPFDSAALRRSAIDEILRIIREHEPPRPSACLTTLTEQELTLAAKRRQTEPGKFPHLLRGDLDWIVMKALEKDRARRYETANGLVKDIERHLSNEPVSARPPGNLYRFQKMVRRHKLAFAAGSAVLAALIVGLGFSTWSFYREQHAHRHADEQTRRALVAEGDARDQLWNSQLEQAKAGRLSRRAGRRFTSLELLKKAAAYRPSLALRNEAIASMAQTDLKLIKELRGPPDIFSYGLDANYERYLFVDPKGTGHLCRLADDYELARFPGYEFPLWELKFSPNGRFLFTSCGAKHEAAEVRNLDENRIVFQRSEALYRTMDFSADSRLMAIAYESKTNDWPIRIFDLASGQAVTSFAHGSLPYYVLFNPRQTNLLLTSDTSSTVRVWDWRTHKVVQSFVHPQPVQGICWSPDGNSVATGCADSKVHLWELASGNERAVLSGHDRDAVQVTFSQDGALLASRGWDGKVCLWDVNSLREIVSLPTPGFMDNFSLNGRKLAAATGAGITGVFEAVDGCGYCMLGSGQLHDRVINCDFSPDGRWLVSAHVNNLNLWDTTTGKNLFQLPKESQESFALFRREGTNVLVGTSEALEEWRVTRTLPENKFGLNLQNRTLLAGRQNMLSFDHERRKVATAANGAIHIFDTATKTEIMRTAAGKYEFAALSPDARFVAAWSRLGDDAESGKGLDVWDVANSNLMKVVPAASGGMYAAFSPNQEWFAVGDYGQFRMWDASTWRLRYTIPRIYAGFYGLLAFSPDSTVLAVAISRNTVQLLDAATGLELATLEAPEPSEITSITFNADGTQLAVGCSSCAIQLWDLHIIRKQLAAMNLDWNLPAYPPPSPDPHYR